MNDPTYDEVYLSMNEKGADHIVALEAEVAQLQRKEDEYVSALEGSYLALVALEAEVEALREQVRLFQARIDEDDALSLAAQKAD
jgi:hypothetical protein